MKQTKGPPARTDGHTNLHPSLSENAVADTLRRVILTDHFHLSTQLLATDYFSWK